MHQREEFFVLLHGLSLKIMWAIRRCFKSFVIIFSIAKVTRAQSRIWCYLWRIFCAIKMNKRISFKVWFP
jgi:hypothetical protein